MTAGQRRDLISQTLETIVEQTASMMEHNGDVPQIEIDIALASIRNLYTEIQQINKTEPEIASTPIQIPPPAPTPVSVPEPEVKVPEIVVTPDPITPTPPSHSPSDSASVSPSASDSHSRSVSVSPSDSVSPDLFSTTQEPQQKKPITENRRSMFEQGGDERISDKMHKSISSIKQAIGINEKYQFMNILFKGDQEGYNLCLNSLDAVATLAEAQAILDSSKQQFGWKEENELNTLQKLSDLVQRKYSR